MILLINNYWELFCNWLQFTQSQADVTGYPYVHSNAPHPQVNLLMALYPAGLVNCNGFLVIEKEFSKQNQK